MHASLLPACATTALRPVWWGVLLIGALLAGCAVGPPRTGGGPASERDGPEAHPPPDLARVPDAEPRIEPIRRGGPNKPYDLYGRSYVPITEDAPYTERGLASWYGRKFQGRRTASGEIYNMYAMTAAHPTLPIPSYARIRNPANGREVVVRINDRGPFHSDRIVDLSYTAALKLDLLRGVAPVELQRITFDDIRSGAWRHDGGADVARLAVREAGVNADPPPSPGSAPPVVAAPVPVQATTADVDAAETAGTASTIEAAAAPALEPIGDAPDARAYTPPARGYWVQLGAFRRREGAEIFQKRVGAEADWLAPLLAVFAEASTYRLQAGPYPSRDAARGAAERVRAALQLVPVIVERR
jgi:rare lipoprotein A